MVDIVLINFSAIFDSVNSNYLPYTVDLILNLMIWIQKQDKFIVIIWKKWSQRWNMETKLWQIPYPMENWKMRYMVVWIQNHDKFIVLIWKTLDKRFGCKIKINSLQCTIVQIVRFFFLIWLSLFWFFFWNFSILMF